MTLRLGTRRSLLAMTQSGLVTDALRARGHDVELVPIVTEGDVTSAPLASLGGTGVFASALREALLTGQVDLAVHSLKDLPVTQPDGLVIAAVPRRQDARDALVARDGLSLGELAPGSVIGTGSPRRMAQLAALGLGLRTVAIRGNVDSRLALVVDGKVDAVVLAVAGLARLQRTEVITERLDPLQVLPAPGQGALAVEVRADDEATRSIVAALEDPDTRAAVTAERALLGRLEAGCSAPVGALAEVVEEVDGSLEVSLRAFVGSVDGSAELRRSLVGPADQAQQVGLDLAELLLADGASAIVDAARPPDPASGGRAAHLSPASTPSDPSSNDQSLPVEREHK